jgi:hypothetical protein
MWMRPHFAQGLVRAAIGSYWGSGGVQAHCPGGSVRQPVWCSQVAASAVTAWVVQPNTATVTVPGSGRVVGPSCSSWSTAVSASSMLAARVVRIAWARWSPGGGVAGVLVLPAGLDEVAGGGRDLVFVDAGLGAGVYLNGVVGFEVGGVALPLQDGGLSAAGGGAGGHLGAFRVRPQSRQAGGVDRSV